MIIKLCDRSGTCEHSIDCPNAKISTWRFFWLAIKEKLRDITKRPVGIPYVWCRTQRMPVWMYELETKDGNHAAKK